MVFRLLDEEEFVQRRTWEEDGRSEGPMEREGEEEEGRAEEDRDHVLLQNNEDSERNGSKTPPPHDEFVSCWT